MNYTHAHMDNAFCGNYYLLLPCRLVVRIRRNGMHINCIFVDHPLFILMLLNSKHMDRLTDAVVAVHPLLVTFA